MTPLDAARCDLGEGAFWHPRRAAFFWVDITAGRLHTPGRHWDFGTMISALGWVDADRLLIAAEDRLFTFDLSTGAQRTLTALVPDRPDIRSNDGRADPWGGFWVSTMGKAKQPGAGAIWRWHDGQLHRLFDGLTIPNAICFAPDARSAVFADTPTGRVMRVALDGAGWPRGAPECWLDMAPEGLNPDGAVTDAAGRVWIAQWGAGRVAAYTPDGALHTTVAVPGLHASCPAFGGAGLADLYCSTAREGRAAPAALDGAAFCQRGVGAGRPEPRVHL